MRTIWTIGHSVRSADEVLSRLRLYGIDRLVDVRTKPHSRWQPQFNRDQFAQFLADHDVNYDWRGRSLGGLAENVGYSDAINQVAAYTKTENVVLMCSERSYKKCHRHTMLAPDFELQGLRVVHIDYE